VTDAEGLAAIRDHGAAGRCFVLPLAMARAAQRGLGASDLRHGLAGARAATWQVDHQTWEVESQDLDCADLTLGVVLIDGSAIVVAVL
jgi:hypothetical protein